MGDRRAVLACMVVAAVLSGCGEKPAPSSTGTGNGTGPAAEGVVSVTDFIPEAPMDPGERPTYVCRRAKRPVTVDGDLVEWTDVPTIVLDRAGQAHRAWKDAADMSGTARLCYDSDYLYLAFDVTDDVFSHTYPLIPIWAGDCVQFAFDPLEDRRRDSRAPDDQEMTVALTAEGPRLARWAGPQGRGDVEAAKLGLVRKSPGGGVVYELAIPWNELAPLAPGLRNAFGFTFTFNDSDGEPNKGWLEWTPGIQDGKDPYSFGQVVLEYTPPAPGASELYVASDVPERPDVASLRFEVFRNTPRDETLKLALALAEGKDTVVETTAEFPVTPGVHMHTVSWQPANLPDGSYEGTLRVTCPDGKTVRQTFSYERLITAPLAARLDAIRAKIAQLAQTQPELYVRYEAGLAYRVEVAALWLAGDSTVRNWQNLPGLVDETERALDAMLAGTDVFASQRGTLLRAYRAPEDDMPQPYRVQVPDDYDGSKPYPLIVNLHGYGGTGLTWDLWYALTVRAKESDPKLRPGYLVVIPYGRGNTGWQGWGRNDVFHVIEAVRRDYRIDAERISVSGFSMGGSGTWYLATRYPHFWSAAGPQAGGLGRYDLLKPEEADDWTKQLSAAGSQMLVLGNLRNLPTVIYHGVADDTVSFSHSEEAYKRLREMKYDAVLIASVRGGHGSVSPALRAGLAEWLVEHQRETAPKEVVYAT
ncbi:MAG TPA: sugar-binding protein, partial [Planctomycetota bacterium]|nr:sugar-binding protein [Planctomycetota bacterium]